MPRNLKRIYVIEEDDADVALVRSRNRERAVAFWAKRKITARVASQSDCIEMSVVHDVLEADPDAEPDPEPAQQALAA